MVAWYFDEKMDDLSGRQNLYKTSDAQIIMRDECHLSNALQHHLTQQLNDFII